MQNSNLEQPVSRVPGTWGSLLVLIGLVLIGMAVGSVLAMMLLAIFLSADLESVSGLLNQLITEPAEVPDGWYALMIFQGTAHFFSYLLPSLIYWNYVERRNISGLSNYKVSSPQVWLLVFILVLIFIPVNSRFIEWNAAMKLPEVLSGLEDWMREREDRSIVMTTFLTSYTTIGKLLIALFVVTLLPALGEEMLFRGIIQTKLTQQLRNPHIAIWISAAIFSAIHFQFYGFLPRMLLGALFGYLYYWTGNFWVTVLAHFVNNGFVLVMMYLHNTHLITINIEETKSMPLAIVVSSLIFTIVILRFIRRESFKERGQAVRVEL